MKSFNILFPGNSINVTVLDDNMTAKALLGILEVDPRALESLAVNDADRVLAVAEINYDQHATIATSLGVKNGN